MKGYKAFGKNMTCKGKRYAENTTFTEDFANPCKNGMHFCENPLDVLDFYPLIDDNGDMTEFAEVEALDEPKTDDNKKYCTTKLHIGAKLDLSVFIKTSFSFIYEKIKESAASGNSAQLAASGNSAQLAASGDYAQLAASGDYAQLAASGDYAKLAASGYSAKLAASGDYAKLAASGYSAKLSVTGQNSVAANIGINGSIRGTIGTWITLAEYDNSGVCVYVKSKQIDGKTLKADTFYKLKNGRFVKA